jgi:putative DNA primase/helicase
VTARGLYQADETSFVPEGKLFLAANHRPEIRGTDLAIWRRVLEVPFAVTITEAERDPTLKARLREPKELAGILGWALAGCREWHGTAKPPRLRPPEAVVAATRAYREEQDCLAPFLEDQCVLEPSGRASNRELRQAYEAWCKGTGERPMSQKAFARRLRERGCTDYRDTSRNRDRGWQGIRLFTMFDQPQEDSDSSDR